MPYFTFEYRTLKLGTQIARRDVVVEAESLEAATAYVRNLKHGTDARKHGEVIEDGRQLTEAEVQEHLHWQAMHAESDARERAWQAKMKTKREAQGGGFVFEDDEE